MRDIFKTALGVFAGMVAAIGANYGYAAYLHADDPVYDIEVARLNAEADKANREASEAIAKADEAIAKFR